MGGAGGSKYRKYNGKYPIGVGKGKKGRLGAGIGSVVGAAASALGGAEVGGVDVGGGITAKENLLLLAKINKKTGEERINEILKQVGLEPDSKKVYRKFSLGMKQKLAIAQAFMEEPKVLLLDEPMNALDEQSVQDMRIMFREYVNKKPAIMVITSHHKEDIEILCDQVYSIKNGYVNL
jgi:ABC-type multidrug transport system ATPase subunit